MFLEIFQELLAEHSLTRKKFAEQSGIPYPTVIGWTNLDRLPDFTALGKIAEFFGCSVDYLMGRSGVEKDNFFPQKTSEEQQLLLYYRKMDEETRHVLLSVAQKLSQT